MTLAAVVLAATTLVTPPPAELRVTLTPASATVGDPIAVDLELRVDAGYEPVLPRWGTGWGAAEIREVSPVEREARGQGGVARQQVVVTFFRPGDFELPQPQVSAVGPDGEVAVTTSSPLTVTIRSVLPADGSDLEPKPPLPPQRMSMWSPAFAWSAGLLALACAVALGSAARRRAARVEADATIGPLTELRAFLAALRAEDPGPAVLSGLSLALRRFLAATLHFPAVESTTTEIRLRLRARDLPADLAARTVTLLRALDGVKFALEPADRELVDRSLADADDVAVAVLEFLTPPEIDRQEKAA